MPAFGKGVVSSVGPERRGLLHASVDIDGEEIDAVGFVAMLGPVAPGDRVVVNTTGIELGLGTGGLGFILWDLDGVGPPGLGEGHIVKLRYTPWQTEVLAAEAQDSPHHDVLRSVDSIDGMPVVACGLHSQVAAVAAGIKATRPSCRVGYLMTDGAALPLAWSELAAGLKEAGLIDVTATCGHAFGGDLETVNVFSGLAALREAGGADVCVVAMGPGIVGTGTALGFSGMEQGQVLDAATALAGTAIACLRISFADERLRHRGVSHHTLTALRLAAREPAGVVVPVLNPEQGAEVYAQLRDAGITQRHRVVEADGSPGLSLLEGRGIRVTSMGRSVDEVPELFLAASAAGAVAGATGSVAPL